MEKAMNIPIPKAGKICPKNAANKLCVILNNNVEVTKVVFSLN